MTVSENPLVALGALTFDAADDASLAAGVRALTTPTFTFRQEGARLDTEGYLAHLHDLRAGFVRGRMTVLDAFVDRSTAPARAAARVLVTMDMVDGTVAEGEALMIGVLEGGLVATLHESGRLLGESDDRPVPTLVTAADSGVLPRYPRSTAGSSR